MRWAMPGFTFLAIGALTNDLNIPKPNEISRGEKSYEAYNYFVNSLLKTGNRAASPCNNFYNYTCEHMPNFSWDKHIMTANTDYVIHGLRKNRTAPWYQSMKREFDHCMKRMKAPGALHQNGTTLKRIFGTVEGEFGPVFPLFDRSNAIQMNSSVFGEFVGFLAQKFRLFTFLPYKIEGGRLLIAEPRLTFPLAYFTHAFSEFETGYKASIKDYLLQLADALDKPLEAERLNQVVDEVVAFERSVAEVLSGVPEEAPTVLSAYKPPPHIQAIDLDAFLTRISKNAPQEISRALRDIQIYLIAPSKLRMLESCIARANPETVLNYLIIRLTMKLKKYFVKKPGKCIADRWLRERRGEDEMNMFSALDKHTFVESSEAERRCIKALSENAYWMQMDRLFLDEQLPDPKGRKEFVSRIKIMTNKILHGFRFQIDQLSWFSAKTKSAAYKKIDEMLFSLVYDDWVENDDELNKRTRRLEDIDANDDDFTAFEKMNDFSQALEWEELLARDRHQNFSESIRTVDAWYDRWINHFYIPLGYMQRPIFDINYPVPIQYGGLGSIIAHELTHGFDPRGVNYDDQGNGNQWMDEPAKAAFKKMVKCVIDQYTNFHGRGQETQTEDIADNGGLRAVWNAYKSEQALYGPSSQLPSFPFNGYTQDQLFFLGYANVFCSSYSALNFGYGQHSPMLYRVMGALQNFPAFQAAFNCPRRSTYAPAEHCDVWASEVKI